MATAPPAPPPGRAEPPRCTAEGRRQGRKEGRKEGSRAAAPGAGQLPRRKEPAGAFRNLHEASGYGESGRGAAQALLRGRGTAGRLGLQWCCGYINTNAE
ncbi:RUN and SH3 domain-containing protein 1-like [Corvus cornix cornix]|uniref:RUN and SH3 domain-containing protein 1-like n=1 Tax=Corvus cornix cornix TaxID=932674 RepID=UPI00194F62E6|nr:RUN and SH3 domain-containing protein 1-like [Corvus cornix cornix]